MQKVPKLRIRRVAQSCSPLRESELALRHQNLQLPLARRRGQTFRALYTPTSGGMKLEEGRGAGRGAILVAVLAATNNRHQL